ncbi:cysteine desulfurase [Paucidesulfovibrio gracilis DSM 16080]|uniref:cysteine desulfurase n=1 Tax=Paucidesulfovibrio gracilis DSM 16080 TaxID=1121449 RepID=A0A1T4W0X1_9BACT|nr:cysteine desulfurase family protein [Paucidesulfovibrio gracilis]SKA70902.1 cysteine desulfurase [Paucidesulfovibrio gracilis DSM 16080]
MRPLYFDHNATTPLAPQVRAAMAPLLDKVFGNPSSGHAWGLDAKEALEAARGQVAALINANPDEICFTSCATEANNTIIQGLLRPDAENPDPGMITTQVEHPSVLEPAREMARRGATLAALPVDNQGRMHPSDLHNALRPNTRLVSVMLANNETGVIQPVWELSGPCREHGVLLHTDASQAVGKIPVDVRALGVDLLTIAGHKLNAPKGIGALFIRRGVSLPALLFGGGQERGLRPGTENTLLSVGLGAACALAGRDLPEEMARRRMLGEVLRDGLSRLGADFMIFGENAARLPNTLLVGFRGWDAGRIVEELALRDVAVSAGAACHAPEHEANDPHKASISHVLRAMDAPVEYAAGSIRFSWGWGTSREDVLDLIERLARVLRPAR